MAIKGVNVETGATTLEDGAQESREQHRGQGGEGGQGRSGGNLLEVIVGVASGLLVLSVIGYLLAEGLREPASPTFETRLEAVREAGGRFYLPVEVENSGDESAADVGVTATLEQEGEVIEEVEATIDWLPGRSTRSANFIFEQDPRAYDVSVEVTGFREP